MNKQIIIRIFIDLLIVIMVINGYWLIALPLAIIGTYLFSYFIEIIIAGLIYDSLFGLISGNGFWDYIGIIFTTFSWIIVVSLKGVVRR